MHLQRVHVHVADVWPEQRAPFRRLPALALPRSARRRRWCGPPYVTGRRCRVAPFKPVLCSLGVRRWPAGTPRRLHCCAAPRPAAPPRRMTIVRRRAAGRRAAGGLSQVTRRPRPRPAPVSAGRRCRAVSAGPGCVGGRRAVSSCRSSARRGQVRGEECCDGRGTERGGECCVTGRRGTDG